MDMIIALRLIDILLYMAYRIPAFSQRIEAIRDEMAAMVSENRDPTQEEADAVGASIDARLARLKAQTAQNG